MRAITLATTLAALMVLFIVCSIASAAEPPLELVNPTARQVVNVQCGTPDQVPFAAGFSQPGDYVRAVFVGFDMCNGSGRAARVTRYYGCAVVSWDLSGYMVTVKQFAANADHSCTVPPDTLYPAPQQYAASIAPNQFGKLHVYLTSP